MTTRIANIDKNYLILASLSALLLIPFLGGVHLFDWDEINFAESAREMILTGDYLTVQINFLPFWEKPPLFIWMQVLSMKAFGINEFAARFPNAICGILTVIVLYAAGKKLFNKQFGLIWAMAYLCSTLPFFYFKSGIIDPWFNLFIFIGIFFFFSYIQVNVNNRQWRDALLSGFFIGLAILTKGPVAFLIYILTVFTVIALMRFRVQMRLIDLVLFGAAMVITGGLWFIIQIAIGNFHVVVDFIEYQVRLFKTEDAGHGGFLLYHFVVLLFGVFPASLFALPAFNRHNKLYVTPEQNQFRVIMIVLLLVVLILFTIVKTKILHYSSLGYFPLTFLAAWTIYKIFKGKTIYKSWLSYLIYPIGSIYAILIMALPVINHFKEQILEKELIGDPFAAGNLQADVPWSGFEVLIGVVLIAGMVLFHQLKKKSAMKAVILLFIANLLFVNLTLICIVPRIEGYSQRAAIEFYKKLQGRDVYVATLGFKSYAHYFYTKKEKPDNELSYNTNWLLTGDIDKDAYFVVKNFRLNRYIEQHDDLVVLYEKNGFVFLKRYAIPSER